MSKRQNEASRPEPPLRSQSEPASPPIISEKRLLVNGKVFSAWEDRVDGEVQWVEVKSYALVEPLILDLESAEDLLTVTAMAILSLKGGLER